MREEDRHDEDVQPPAPGEPWPRRPVAEDEPSPGEELDRGRWASHLDAIRNARDQHTRNIALLQAHKYVDSRPDDEQKRYREELDRLTLGNGS